MASKAVKGRYTDARTAALIAFASINLFAMVFLQKFGLPAGASSVQLVLPIYYASLCLMAVGLRIEIEPVRLIIFGLLCAAMMVSQMLSGVAFDLPAMAIVLMLYGPYVLCMETDEATYRRILMIFQRFMYVIVLLVFAQHAVQFTVGISFWPSLQDLPSSLLFPGYNYMQPFEWGSPYIKPNAIVFLETSFISQFLAIALVIEIAIFRRIWALAFFAAGIVASMAGTGLFILAMTAPFLLFKLSPKLLLAGVLVLGVVAAGAASLGWNDMVVGRINEFTMPGTSGYNRYIRPMERVASLAQNPAHVIAGNGAGKVPFGQGGNDTLPLTKMFDEYGLIATVFLLALVLWSLLAGAPSKRIALVLFFYYNLGGGGLSVPVYALLPILLAANLRISPSEATARVEQAPATAPPPQISLPGPAAATA